MYAPKMKQYAHAAVCCEHCLLGSDVVPACRYDSWSCIIPRLVDRSSFRSRSGLVRTRRYWIFTSDVFIYDGVKLELHGDDGCLVRDNHQNISEQQSLTSKATSPALYYRTPVLIHFFTFFFFFRGKYLPPPKTLPGKLLSAVKMTGRSLCAYHM